MTILAVGPGPAQYATIQSALGAAANGDTITVPAGLYLNQYATIRKNVAIKAVGGIAYFVSTRPVPNAKGIFVVNAPGKVTISNLAFSGARTSNANGANAAGIRYQRGNLTLSHDSFHNNQNGLLATPGTNGTGNITIIDSTFTKNGVANRKLTSGYGYTHNIYVTHVKTLTITGSTITQANAGNEIKSRALSSTIRNSLIADGPVSTASYSIDLPNAGAAIISGNTIEQGPNAQNSAIISNGEEGAAQPGTLKVTDNTIINKDLHPSSTAVVNKASTQAIASNNVIAGLTPQHIASGNVEATKNAITFSQPRIRMKILKGNRQLASGSAIANTLTRQWSRRGQRILEATAYPGPSIDITVTPTGKPSTPLRFIETQTGLTSATATASLFDTNARLNCAKIRWRVYANANNAPFGTSTLLGSRIFTDFGQMISASSRFSVPFRPTQPYSLTVSVKIIPPSHTETRHSCRTD